MLFYKDGNDENIRSRYMKKTVLTGLTPEEIYALLPKVKERYRGMQIFKWINDHCAEAFEEMTNISKPFREELADRFIVRSLDIAEILTSQDESTEKYLFSCADGAYIESVIIRDEDRTTICVSSQVGCRMSCSFCRTGGMGFIRNLTAGEIVDQLILIRRSLRSRGEDITNIVFMGMGDPLDNFDEVIKAVTIINLETGLGIGQRKITISTCGITPKILELGHQFKRIGLAVSLNAAEDDLRTRLMPINKKYPLTELLETSHEFTRITKRRVTFEYILIAGVNDSPAHAKKFRKLVSRMPSKVNLIAFNEYEGCPFKRPSDDVIEEFQRIVIEGNITAFLRKSKGTDILAACGQLASKRN